ncbi:MAG: hypothetical protein WC101_00440 [Candidatus Gracilibacteria bacterium]
MDQVSHLIATTGLAGYAGLAGLGILFVIGYISIPLGVGMLLYSLFSKNWGVWRAWRYIGYALCAALGFFVLAMGISVTSGMFKALTRPSNGIVNQVSEMPQVKTDNSETLFKENDPVANNLRSFFDKLPDEYCDRSMREPVLIYDEKNFYMKTGTDLTKGGAHPSYDYCEFVIFKNTSGGDDVYGIVKATIAPMLPFGEANFLKYQNGKWIKITDQVMSIIDSDELNAKGSVSIASKAPELAREGLDGNYILALPRIGTVIEFIHYNTKETIYKLKWSNSNFVKVEG